MAFSPAALLKVLDAKPTVHRYWVAYSGGLDSHCLLHALSSLRPQLGGAELAAVHIHHGLSPNADHWLTHCTEVCDDLGVPLRSIHVHAHPAAGESPEAAARAARYRALEDLIGVGDELLTAHHQDDQAETLLIQLLRGSGVAGLSAMPSIASFGGGHHRRPLLGFTREELHGYAEREGLRWIDDESNARCDYDRNYLRHHVMPAIKARWPAASVTLARSAANCAEANSLLAEVAAQDLATVSGTDPAVVRIPSLVALSPERQRNVLRAWIAWCHLPVPDKRHLERVLSEVIPAAVDATPEVIWPGGELRRYRDCLYVMSPLPAHDASESFVWRLDQPWPTSATGQSLHVIERVGQGITGQLHGEPLTIRYRLGGERLQPAGRPHHRELKTLLQEAGVPPWQRNRLPLIYYGDALIAVADLWVAEGYQARPNEPGIVLARPRTASTG